MAGEQEKKIHIAANLGNTEDVRTLLMSSANVDERDSFDNTPLHHASNNGHIGTVNLLLSKNATVNSRNSRGETPLHFASGFGHFSIAQILLKNDADVHATDQSNNTPIDIAKKHSPGELVQLLMSSIEYSRNDTSLLYSAATYGNAIDVRQLFMNNNANPDALNLYGDTPLHLACENRHLEVVEILLSNNADVYIRNASGKTPLHISSEMGYVEIVKSMIDHGGKVDAIDSNGDAPLHLASENGHLEVVEVLLRNTADANIYNASFKTPLHIASELGYVEIVKSMIDHGGNVDTIDNNGDTALHLAARCGHIDVVNTFLNLTTEIDAMIRSKYIAVGQIAAGDFQPSQHPVRTTVEAGHKLTTNKIAPENGNAVVANIELGWSSIENTVVLSAEQEYSEMLENTIFNGANVNACNKDKMTPLHLACRHGHTSTVEILLNNHATIDVIPQSGETLFYLAAANGHAEVTDLLLRRGVWDFVFRFDTREYLLKTPLHAAIEEGHSEVVEVILKHCRGISEKSTKAGEKLHENTKRGVMRVELRKSDDRRVSAEIVWTEKYTPLELKRDDGGCSPLKYAASTNDPKMVELLLSVDECLYSETDITESFVSITADILPKDIVHEASSDPEKYKMNIRKFLKFLINSKLFNVNHQDNQLDSFVCHVMRQMSLDGCNTEDPDRLCLQTEIEVIQLLLEKGADFNMKNAYGETPLMIASQVGCCEAIQTLFDWEGKSGLKVDTDARDWHGTTALIKATEKRHVSVMQLLLKYGASANLYDNNGFTALHVVFYDPYRRWLDMHILDKTLCGQEKYNIDEHRQTDHKDSFDEITIRIKEEMVKLLLDNVETDINAKDFSGNTPLDLAMMSCKPLTSATFEALKNRGATLNLLDLKGEEPVEEALVDERGRNPLHLLFISFGLSFDFQVQRKMVPIFMYSIDSMANHILQRPDSFRDLAIATDDKGRTPLHYAVMLFEKQCDDTKTFNIVKAFLKLGFNLNAADNYGKTLLHYVERDELYAFLVQLGASENIKDKWGYTPKELKQLRDLVTINESNTMDLPIGKNKLYISTEVVGLLDITRVTELSKQKMIEKIRICSQSPRQRESLDEAIWKIWNQDEFFRVNTRLSQLHVLIHRFVERLADGIKEKDWRFECQPILVGSAEEGTKAVISGDVDFNLKLIKFSQLCDPFPHPLGPKGYFQLRRKSSMTRESWNDGEYDCFFNSDQCLLTDEVNSRFKIIIEDVLRDHNFCRDEPLFECGLPESDYPSFDPRDHPDRVCETVFLRMIHPIEDGEGGSLFVNITIDIAACVDVEDWWPEDSLQFGIDPAVKTDGCTFVFHRPLYDISTPHYTNFLFNNTFARISFASFESRIIKESSPIVKAAYMVCKMILNSYLGATYQLKTCIFFCMEALRVTTQSGSEARNKFEITQEQLAFWVERIIFCFMEFCRHRAYSLYFMPSFMQKVEIGTSVKFETIETQEDVEVESIVFPAIYNIYLDLCPDDAAFEIPVVHHGDRVYQTNAYCDCPGWKEFDREELIRKLSSRSLSSSIQF